MKTRILKDMKTSIFRKAILCLTLVLGSLAALAQEVTVTVTPIQRILPPQVMLYITEPANYFNVSLTNTGKDNANVYLVMQVEQVNPFKLTKEQTDIMKAIDQNVVCDVDKKTMVITINVTDQDALICATMADSVKHRLQNFITDYRTSKARVDLEYNKKLSVEAKSRYEQARNRYTAYSDSHRGVTSQSGQTKEADLQNEMNLQQQIYQQVVAQLQQAEMKVQQETPAFTTLQSATVPVLKAGPKRAQMCLIFLFLAFLGTTGWILYKENDLKPLLGLS